MFGLSFGELFLIAFIALLLFGNDQLPFYIKRGVGFLQRFRQVSKTVQNSWYEIKEEVLREEHQAPAQIKTAPHLLAAEQENNKSESHSEERSEEGK